MEKWLSRLEKEYGDLYKDIFTELSKLQIEEKFLERQAQTLVEEIRRNSTPELESKLQQLLESNDPDFVLQSEHSNHLYSIGEIPQSERVSTILAEHFGSESTELYMFK